MKISYDKDGMIEGNLYDLPRELRMKAGMQRLKWIFKDYRIYMIIILFIILMSQLNLIKHQQEILRSFGK